MRKILFNTVALAFRARPKIPQLTQKLAFTFMAYPIIRHGFQNVNMSDHYELNFEDDLKEGEMREFQVGPQKEDAVMVCKVRGKLYCVSNACSHAGAPLSAGFLVNDKVKCPWHNASFSVIDGSLEEGPMLNGIQTFEVVNVNGQVSIKIQKDLLNKKRQLNMFTKKNDNHHIVIVGGGIAGQSAAETLRQTGFEGKITIVNSENHLPYDRTPMSKFLFQFGPQGIQARNQEFYDKYGIDVLTNTTVDRIDIEKRLVHFGQNELKYDKLLIATGGSARRPAMDGVNLQNVHTLRTMDDAQNIKALAKTAKNIVIVGASFIGMETASALKKELKDQVNITVVDSTSTPFERVLGTEVGSALQQLHESNGINFELLAGVKKLSGTGEVQKVELLNGKSLLADIVILGTGIIPNNSLIKDQLKLAANGGIETDVFLKAAPNVYAAGDIASYPYWVTGDSVRIEHQNEAIRQGTIAAFNLLGKPVPIIDIPFFWTRQWDRTLAYSGVGNGFDEVIVDGSLNDLKFIAYYARKGQIVASASMNVPNAQMIISEAMRLNLLPTAAILRESKLTLDQIKQSVIERSPSCACKRTRLNQHKL